MAPKPRFPIEQIIVLSLCRLVEPICFVSIFPYMYYLVASFGFTKSEKEIGMWTGTSVAAFALGEVVTGMMWGRISDRIGRKPVLMAGLAGTGFSMIIFGFSVNMPMAILARFLGGLLNGNVGVIQTAIAELVPEKEFQPRAYTVVPFVWSLGSILGPAMGGLLAEPVKNYPNTFPPGGILERFPYALPNIVCAVTAVFGVTIGILFLDETHEELKKRPDRGREVGRYIQSYVTTVFRKMFMKSRPDHENQTQYSQDSRAPISEASPLLGPDHMDEHDYNSALARPKSSSSSDSGSETSVLSMSTVPTAATATPTTSHPPKQASILNIWTPQVRHNIAAYCILCAHSISFGQVFLLFLQSPPPETSPHLPFKFLGGFGLSTQTTGVILSAESASALVFQFIFYPWLASRAGVLRLFHVVVIAYPLLYFLTPYIALVPREYLMPVVYAVVCVKLTLACSAYPSNAILLTNSAPSLLVLGTINGMAASLSSLCKAISPVLAGIAFSFGMKAGYVILAWWILGAVATVGSIQCLWIHDRDGQGNQEHEHHIPADEEEEEFIREVSRTVVVDAAV